MSNFNSFLPLLESCRKQPRILQQVRDVFLIGCYTALRYSDFSKIEKGCIGSTLNGTKVIRLNQQKTKGKVVIPILNDELETLLKKYDYNGPEVCEQVINRYI